MKSVHLENVVLDAVSWVLGHGIRARDPGHKAQISPHHPKPTKADQNIIVFPSLGGIFRLCILGEAQTARHSTQDKTNPNTHTHSFCKFWEMWGTFGLCILGRRLGPKTQHSRQNTPKHGFLVFGLCVMVPGPKAQDPASRTKTPPTRIVFADTERFGEALDCVLTPGAGRRTWHPSQNSFRVFGTICAGAGLCALGPRPRIQDRHPGSAKRFRWDWEVGSEY